MNWDALDFAVFFGLLIILGAAWKLAAKVATGNTYRFGVGVALAATFFLVWVNGAVGIIGSADNDANMLYFGVLAVGLIGAIIARFRPQGMAMALIATAIAQVAVAVVALVAGWGTGAPAWPSDVLVITALFAAMWIGAAWLFRRAALSS